MQRKSTRKVRHRVGGGRVWPGKGIGISHRMVITMRKIKPRGNIDTVARFRKPSLSDTESGKAMDNGVVESEDVEEKFSELEHRIAAEFAKHAGRKTVKLEDLKLARTMAGLLTGPLF